MKRVLLLIPTTTYRTQAFVDAARRLDVQMTVCSERPNVFAEKNPGGLLTLNFADVETAASTVVEFTKRFSIDAVVGVDDQTTVVAAGIAAALSLPHNSLASVSAARNKYLMREVLQRNGVAVPMYALFSIDDQPADVAREVTFPCVLKPLMLSASRGVIRADNEEGFAAAFRRLGKILRASEFASDEAGRQCLVENFVPGREVALEGLLVKGKFKPLAIFDKPDPLDGPFFEETIYVTPSRLSQNIQEEVISCADRATRALGLEEGPVHAELRINDEGSWVIEIAARSIGGFCSRALRFVQSSTIGSRSPDLSGTGISLEELILRHALGTEIGSFQRESKSSGVMMIPIPRAGVLREVGGLREAKAVKRIEDIIISSYLGETLVPLPEGGKYLGFIFTRAESPEGAEKALREAHRRLEFAITPGQRTVSDCKDLQRKASVVR